MAEIDIGEGPESISEMEKGLTREEQASLFPRPVHVKEKVRDLTRKEEKRSEYTGNPDLPINSTMSPLDAIGLPAMLGVRAVPSLVAALSRTMRRPESAPVAPARPPEQYGPAPNPQSNGYTGINGDIRENQLHLENLGRLLQQYPRQSVTIGQLADQRGLGGLAAIERYVARRSALPLPE